MFLIPLAGSCSLSPHHKGARGRGAARAQEREFWRVLEINMLESGERDSSCLPESTLNKHKQLIMIYQYSLYYTQG